MDEKKTDTQPKKKGFFALIKESMNETSSGCGPGCGCTPEEPDRKRQNNDNGEESGISDET